MAALTADRLKELVSYDPVTGVFTYKVARPELRRHVGDEAGRVGTHGYLAVVCDRKQYLLHRLAFLYMTGKFPAGCVDHIDGNKLNNSWSNLRLADKRQNGANRGAQINNKLGVKGVSFDGRRNKFYAKIKVNGKHLFLGRFLTIEEAA